MARWVRKESTEGYSWFEARFLTLWGARRALRKSGFVPAASGLEGHYRRELPHGMHALADIQRRFEDGRFVVAVRYYDQYGNRRPARRSDPSVAIPVANGYRQTTKLLTNNAHSTRARNTRR